MKANMNMMKQNGRLAIPIYIQHEAFQCISPYTKAIENIF